MSGIRVNEANACNGASGEEPAICNNHENIAAEIDSFYGVIRDLYGLRDKIFGADGDFVLPRYEVSSLAQMLHTAPSVLAGMQSVAKSIIDDIEKNLFE
jgi:hypothetical protein